MSKMTVLDSYREGMLKYDPNHKISKDFAAIKIFDTLECKKYLFLIIFHKKIQDI